MQTTSHLLMIRPVQFAFNPQTAVNNAFQVASPWSTPTNESLIHTQALEEFDRFVGVLHQQGPLDVTVLQDPPHPSTPDSIFPNNWISFHPDGVVCLYPMFAVNRRQERKPTVLQQLTRNFIIKRTIDLTDFERDNLFLEGTGSMVLDREHKIAYACLSPRTEATVLKAFCEEMGYEAVVFKAVDDEGRAIYHTNVMMSVAENFVVICLQSIADGRERQGVLEKIQQTDKEIIEISLEQVKEFAGNVLQVRSSSATGERLLVMSSRAYASFTQDQMRRLTAFSRVLHAPLTTIETYGGGSARCMLAELFLQPRSTQVPAVWR